MRYLVLLFLFASGALLLNPPEGAGCGGFPPVAQFGYVNNPGPEFLKGQLGIISPKYFRRNLVIAYRYLSGVPLSSDEVKALEPPPAPSSFRAVSVAQDPITRWMELRKEVAGARNVDMPQTFRVALSGGKYSSYSNCLDDAFLTAVETLNARRQLWGEKSPLVLEWLRGQDEVFANCGGGVPYPWASQSSVSNVHAPPPLPAGANPLLNADRQYQAAAAAFYSERFQEAERGFIAVSANPDSPWRDLGDYLAARAMIRRGTVDGDKDALAGAVELLDAILRNPARKSLHASARGLRDYVRGQLQPEDRMVELGDALSKPGLGDGIGQAMIDYTMLWDRINRGPAQRSDLADWITALQNGDRRRVLQRWQEGGGTPWLVAALIHAQPGDVEAPGLVAAARGIAPANPGYATAAYHGIRLQTALGDRDEARGWAEEALGSALPADAENAIRGLRMALARDWSEFLRYAPRRVLAETTYEWRDQTFGSPHQLLLDSDAANALNVKLPLSLWLDAASNKLLPPNIQADIAQAGWVRSVILNRDADSRAFSQRLSTLRPELEPALSEYASEGSRECAKFTAVLLMLRHPGLTPLVDAGFHRETKVDRIDGLRDNWWALAGSFKISNWRGDSAGFRELVDYAASEQVAFLDKAQSERAGKEWAALVHTAPIAPNYLCAETLAWARAHPQDPRAPEALHLAVRSTRFGLRDDATAGFSRRAFRLLHSRYGKSEWAAKTKYWY